MKLEAKHINILEIFRNFRTEDAGAIKLQPQLRLLVSVLIVYVDLGCPYTWKTLCLFLKSYVYSYSLFFFFNKFIYFIYIYFWLRWVFVAAHGLSLVAASGGDRKSVV